MITLRLASVSTMLAAKPPIQRNRHCSRSSLGGAGVADAGTPGDSQKRRGVDGWTGDRVAVQIDGDPRLADDQAVACAVREVGLGVRLLVTTLPQLITGAAGVAVAPPPPTGRPSPPWSPPCRMRPPSGDITRRYDVLASEVDEWAHDGKALASVSVLWSPSAAIAPHAAPSRARPTGPGRRGVGTVPRVPSRRSDAAGRSWE